MSNYQKYQQILDAAVNNIEYYKENHGDPEHIRLLENLVENTRELQRLDRGSARKNHRRIVELNRANVPILLALAKYEKTTIKPEQIGILGR